MYRERLKLMHACIFFTENCADVGRMKLYKLLFLLDFENYKELGRPVTGLHYNAWEMGPVPADFHNELQENLGADLAIGLRPTRVTRRFDFEDDDEIGYETEKLVPRIPFNENLFSPRELDLMTGFAKQYFNYSAKQMSTESHSTFGYWDEIWNQRNQHFAAIPYESVFDRKNTSRDQVMREFANERKGFAELSR